jgi:hypothetical protein
MSTHCCGYLLEILPHELQQAFEAADTGWQNCLLTVAVAAVGHSDGLGLAC